MYIITSILIKTNVDIKIYDFFYIYFLLYNINFFKNRCYHFYVNIDFPKLMLTVILLTSVNNRYVKSLITDVKTLFSSSVIKIRNWSWFGSELNAYHVSFAKWNSPPNTTT